MQQDASFDPVLAEYLESTRLINGGFDFEVQKQSPLRLFSKSKVRKFTITEPCLGALFFMNHQFLQIELNPDAFENDNFASQPKFLAEKALKRLANIIAIAVLNKKWTIKLFAGILGRYFFWRLKPTDLREISGKLFQICNYQDFIHSIRYMSIVRVTTPKRIEEEQQG